MGVPPDILKIFLSSLKRSHLARDRGSAMEGQFA